MARIILVKTEDDPDLETAIKNLGHEIISISSTLEEAMHITRRIKPDLIIIDLPQLKKIDQQHIQEIKELNIPLLQMESTYDNKTELYHLKKPYTIKQIRESINQILKYKTQSPVGMMVKKFLAITKNMPQGMIISKKGIIKYANPRIGFILKLDPDSLEEKNILDLITYSSRKIFQQEIEKIRQIEGLSTDNLEIGLHSTNGSLVICEVKLYSLEWEGETYEIIFFNDITAKRSTEAELSEIEKQLELKLETILSPDYTVEEEELKNILNTPQIQSLMDNFYKLTHIGVSILDIKGNILVSTGWQDICTQFHRLNKESCKNCLESDLYLTQDLQLGEYRIYKCKNNMWDMVTPIYLGQKHVGNLFLGQFFFDDEEIDYQLFSAQARKYGFNTSEYLKALDRVPRWSREKVETAMRFYSQFSQLISKLSYSNLILTRTLQDYKKSQEELKITLEATTTGIWKWDFQSDELYFSPHYYTMLGYEVNEFPANFESWVQLIHPDDREKALHVAETYLATKPDLYENTFRLRTKNGDYRWIHATGKVVERDGQGNALRMIGNHEDIHDKKIAELALEESEEKFRSIIQQSYNGVVICDQQGLITTWNQKMEQMTGFSSEEVLGQPLYNIILQSLSLRDPQLQDRISKTIKSMFQEMVIPEKYQKLQYTLIRPDGVLKDVESNNFIIKTSKEKLLCTILRDISHEKKIENKLKESETYYRTIFKYSGTAMVIIEEDKTISLANEQFQELSGYSPEELKGCPWTRFVHPDDLPRMKEYHKKRRLESDRVPDNYEFRFINRKGDLKNILLYVSLIPGTKKSIASLLDLTELKHVQRERDRIFNYSLDMLSIAGFDGYFKELNPAWERTLGWTNEELMSKPYLDFVHPDDKKATLKAAEVLDQGGNMIGFENRYLCRDRSYKWLSWNSFPLTKEKLIFAVARDVTSAKRVEEELKASKEKFESIFQNAAEGIIVIDLQGKVVEANEKIVEISGIPREELINHNIARLLFKVKIDVRKSLLAFKDFIRGKKLEEQEWTFKNRKGKKVTIISKPTLIRKDDKIQGVIIVLEDVTERERTEKNLKKSLEEKEILLREVHHRVKNNMQIISSLLNLQTQYVEGEETQNVLQESQNRVRAMAMIHEKLYQSPDLSHVNFREYTNKLVSDLLYSYGAKNKVKIRMEIENIQLGIETSIPLGLIINELVTNSLKYAFKDGEGIISLKLERKPEHYTLTISDNGIGFEENIDPFKTSTLGLRIVKSLVDQLEGTIKFNQEYGPEFKINFHEIKYQKRF